MSDYETYERSDGSRTRVAAPLAEMIRNVAGAERGQQLVDQRDRRVAAGADARTENDRLLAELRRIEDERQADDARSRLDDDPRPEETVPEEEGREALEEMLHGERRSATFLLPRETRDLTTDVATAGGNTVPTSFVRELQRHLIELSTIRQTRATVLRTDSGEDLEVPKTTGHPTATIVSEGAAIGESDPSFGQVTLGAFKYGFLVQPSTELMEDTGIDLESYLAEQGGTAIANAQGAHFTTGSGTGQPRGVVTAATVGVTGGTGQDGKPTADEIIALKFSVAQPYRRRAEWMMSDATWEGVRKLKDAQNNYLVGPLGVAGEQTLLGQPVVLNPDMPDAALSAKSVAYGDFSTYAIRDVRSVRVERSDDFAFSNDLVTFRFLMRSDGNLVDETGSIKVYEGGAT